MVRFLFQLFVIIFLVQTQVYHKDTCGNYTCKVKVKESRNGPGVAQRVPGSLGSQISMIFGT